MEAVAGGHWYDIFCRRGQSSAAEPDTEATAGFYLRRRHKLIRRHEESLHLNPDHTARWQLRVDLELPGDPGAVHMDGDEEVFLFPVVYLRKNESRMQFSVFEEEAGPLPIPTRKECNYISAEAVAQAFNFIFAEIADDELNKEDLEALQNAFLEIPSSNALEASMGLQWLRMQLGIIPTPSGDAPSPVLTKLGQEMRASGLDEMLEMLVEHALLWVPLRGRANERRSVTLAQEINVRPRAMIRWSFGAMRKPTGWDRRHLRWARLARGEERPEDAVIRIAGKPYSWRDWRFSPSALGERIGRPLGWMPFEFDLPTTYTKRCGSYHLEIRCPPGHTVRDLKVKRSDGRPADPKHSSRYRLRLTPRSARFDAPHGGIEEIAQFRVFTGIGKGYFPLTWFLAGAITTVMLWVLAGSSPDLTGDRAQTTAGILLLVPALLAGLAATGGEIPLAQLIGASRVLLLTTGLCAVVAASVFAGLQPFGLSPSTIWSICAMVATASTVPLATSWILSSPLAWRLMRRLSTFELQKFALTVGVFLCSLAILALALLPADSWLRALPAAFLIAEMIILSGLASNRAAMPVDADRRYLGFSLLLTGLVSLGVACAELACLVYEHALQTRSLCVNPVTDPTEARLLVEVGGLVLIGVALVADLIAVVFAKRAEPRDDEIQVAPRDLSALIKRDSVRDLPALFENEQKAGRRA